MREPAFGRSLNEDESERVRLDEGLPFGRFTTPLAIGVFAFRVLGVTEVEATALSVIGDCEIRLVKIALRL